MLVGQCRITKLNAYESNWQEQYGKIPLNKPEPCQKTYVMMKNPTRLKKNQETRSVETNKINVFTCCTIRVICGRRSVPAYYFKN
jgi:ferredoxin-like protein FixX